MYYILNDKWKETTIIQHQEVIGILSKEDELHFPQSKKLFFQSKGNRIEFKEQEIWIHLSKHQKKASIDIVIVDQMIAFYCANENKKNALLELFQEQKEHLVDIPKVLSYFLEIRLKGEQDHLEQLEKEIMELEERVLEHQVKDINKAILILRKKILYVHHYYNQLIAIGEELQDNENGLIRKPKLLSTFIHRSERYANTCVLLKDYVTQVIEAYQSGIDIELNKVMKVFTVVTVIFLPLTLIVGWYGMNFTNMPELSWELGYPFVIILSISSILLCIYYFKKKRVL